MNKPSDASPFRADMRGVVEELVSRLDDGDGIPDAIVKGDRWFRFTFDPSELEVLDVLSAAVILAAIERRLMPCSDRRTAIHWQGRPAHHRPFSPKPS